mgnify:CR=1 FL=1
MRKIKFEKKEIEIEIDISEIDECEPIFAKQDGKLRGMIIKEDEGWILKIGPESGATGHYKSRQACIESCLEYDYTFYIED